MSSMTVKVEINPAGISDVFKTSEEIGAALLEKGRQYASMNSASAQSYIHDSKGFRNEPYTADLRVLEHTQVCVVHSTNKIAAAIGRKHGLPKQ